MKNALSEEKRKLTVLLGTEAMDIGGAETHICDLALGLISAGFRVILMSEGGRLANKLSTLGVTCVSVTWKNRNPKILIPAYKKVLSVIREYKPDILHAHSRVPALLFHFASKRTKLPFVTTDHAKFSTEGLFTKFLSKWGDKTIAVSGDLKEYLLKNYRSVCAKNIYITINGIDTSLFINRQSNTEFKNAVYDEFKIPHDKKIILSVSRLSKTAYLCVFELLSIAKELYKLLPDSRLVIVGDGDIFDEVKEKASIINKELDTEYVILTGARTDIYRFCGVCSLFVGCARSAIEAASCEKSVIIAGNGGYLGLLSEDNLDFCKKSNFTARGINGFPKDLLLDDIVYAMSKDKELNKFCSYARSIICEEYSVKKMTGDYENVYYKAMRSKNGSRYDCTVTGYYGHGNFGDDALLMCVTENLRKLAPYLRILILCKSNKSLKATLKSEDISVKNRFNPFSVLSAFSKSNALIFGGGTLLQDNTSTKSLLYYTTLIKLAHMFKMKIMLYANGVGPIRHERNKKRTKSALEMTDVVTLRDMDSKKLIEKLNVSHKNIFVTADEALTFSKPSLSDIETAKKKYNLENKNYVIISIRKWSHTTAAFYKSIAESLRTFCKETNLIPAFVVMEKSNDVAITKNVARRFSDYRIISPEGESQDIISITAEAKFVISMRLHTLIFAASNNIPIYGIAYDPKVKSFLEYIGADDCYCDIDNFNTDTFLNAILSEYNKIKKGEKLSRRRKKAESLRLLALENAKIAMELLDRHN